MARIIGPGIGTGEQRAPIDSGPVAFWPVLGAAGLVLTAVGFLDLLLLWVPFEGGRPDWEFGAISAHFDGMALGTVGLTLLMAASLARGRRRVASVLAVVSGLIGVGLIGLLLIYLLDVPIALNATAGRMRTVMVKSIGRTSGFALLYIWLYAWLSWHVWRAARRPAIRHPD